jgi:hypothetical protein
VALRAAARSRSRVAAGVGLLALALAVNLAVYRSLDDRHEVVQVIRDVPAGQRIVAGDLRTVEVGVDGDVRAIRGESMALVVGQYAKVRLISGSLMVTEALQPTPLVGPGSALVAVVVPAAELPIGLRERSHVRVVPVADGAGREAVSSAAVEARVVGLPTSVESATGDVGLTLEVPVGEATAVATAAKVRIVVLEPGVDPASAGAS